MEMLPSQEVFTDQKRWQAGDIPPIVVRREMFSRAIGNPYLNRIGIIAPLGVIAAASFGSQFSLLLWWLVGVQMLCALVVATLARRAKQAIDAGLTAKLPVRIWLTSEAVAAAIWGLMLIATVNHTESSVVTSVISVTVVATITASTLVSAMAPGMPRAILIGFATTAWPIVILNFEAFGLLTAFAFFAILPVLWHSSATMTHHAFLSLQNEMENRILTAQLAAALDTAEYLSRHDALTGLLNRRDFKRAAQELRDTEKGRSIAFIALDLDRFKMINDNYGHAMGDSVLVSTANLLRNQIRTQDIESVHDELTEVIARWGGEEFIIALAIDTPADALAVAHRLCDALSGLRNADWPCGLTVSASFGLSIWQPQEALHSAISRADFAMYDAKASGRNCVREASDKVAKSAA